MSEPTANSRRWIALGKGTGGFTYLDIGPFYFTFSWGHHRRLHRMHPDWPFYSRMIHGAWIGPLWVGRMR